MNKNLIINAFYSDNKKVNMVSNKGNKNGYDIYIYNILVSLCSAKNKNPNDDVALITNLRLPSKYEEMFKKEKIEIIIHEFDSFAMPTEFEWSYAFYKLSALKYVTETMNYNNILLLDTDTYIVKSLSVLWKECDGQKLLLYNTRHDLNHAIRKQMNIDYKKLFNNSNYSYIEQYGGEFICGKKNVISNFVKELEKVYEVIKNNDFNISKESGDELLISIAANYLDVSDAGAYVERFWTQKFYLASTKWKYDSVYIWHLPAEKRYGMISLYNYYKKHGCFPSISKSSKMVNLPRGIRISNHLIKVYICKIFDKFPSK